MMAFKAIYLSFVYMSQGEFLSAPEDGVWEVVLDKTCLTATLF